MALQFLLFEYMKSVRLGDFDFYMSSLHQFAPWIFILDHHSYSRWLPVHIWDMLLLKERHPREYAEFQKGHFVVHKTSCQFSAISLDHYHEQMNAIIKGQGGEIGLAENDNAL